MHWPGVTPKTMVELSREENKKPVLPAYPPHHICDLRCSFEGVGFDLLYYFIGDTLRLLDIRTDLTDMSLKFILSGDSLFLFK